MNMNEKAFKTMFSKKSDKIKKIEFVKIKVDFK